MTSHTDLTALTADALSVAYTKAHHRALGATGAARTRALNEAKRLQEELHGRGFRLVRVGEEDFSFDRF